MREESTKEDESEDRIMKDCIECIEEKNCLEQKKEKESESPATIQMTVEKYLYHPKTLSVNHKKKSLRQLEE
jgi:hypothetical protein